MDNLFGFGGLGEIFLILFVALIFLGPEKMIGFARSLGKWVNQIKTASDNITNQIAREVEENKKALEEATGSLKKEVEEQRKLVSGIANDFAGDIKSQVKSITDTAKDITVPAVAVNNPDKPPENISPPVSKEKEATSNAGVAAASEKPTVPDVPG